MRLDLKLPNDFEQRAVNVAKSKIRPAIISSLPDIGDTYSDKLDRYVPYDTGLMSQDITISTKPNKLSINIAYNQPYAQNMYDGVTYAAGSYTYDKTFVYFWGKDEKEIVPVEYNTRIYHIKSKKGRKIKRRSTSHPPIQHPLATSNWDKIFILDPETDNLARDVEDIIRSNL